MIRAVLGLLLLGGCAAQACKPSIITEQAPPKIVTKTVYIKEPPPKRGSVIIDAYQDSEPQQNQIALKGTIPALQKLTTLKLAVRNAFVPLQTKGHRPTDAELKRAVVAYGALQSFINEPHAVRKSP